jgi:uncharacterized membrane protein YeaQ/YmgE (transglycosylase-associated protein family)
MDCLGILVTALIGCVAGWLAGLLVQGRGFGAVALLFVVRLIFGGSRR